MVICLDTVGRKSVTVGRADDNGCSVEGRVYLTLKNTIARSFFANKQK
jgi:hypothetical protein